MYDKGHNVMGWWFLYGQARHNECNSPPPTSNSLGSHYLIKFWRYVNLSMCRINIYFALPTIFFIKMKQLRFKSRSMAHTLCKANLLHTSSGRHSKRIFNGAQYMTLQKYFSLSSLVIYFSNHTHQIKIGTTNSWKTLITKQLDQSLWLTNPKHGEYLDYIYYITLS